MVKIFLVNIIRPARWRLTLWKRSVVEYFQRFRAWRFSSERKVPYVVYLTGMPRTGSSYMKNYLGAFDGLTIMPFEPRGFHKTWEKSIENNGKIYVDKSTHYIRHLEKIFSACEENVYLCCIVRDPRDQLASLFDFERHPELPRSNKFWSKWFSQYNGLLRFAEKNPNYKFCLIRYEDLVRSPLEVKEFFLRWVGFEVNGKELSSRYSVAHEGDIQDDKVSTRETPSDEGIGRFSNVSNPDRIEVINEYKDRPEIVSLMECFGYFPSLSNHVSVDLSNISVYGGKQQS